MSHIYNTMFLEQAYELALDYGLAEVEAQKFANEMFTEGIEKVFWPEILNDVVKCGGDEYQDYKNEAVLTLNSR